MTELEQVYLTKQYIEPKTGNVYQRKKYYRVQLPEKIRHDLNFVRPVENIVVQSEVENEKKLNLRETSPKQMTKKKIITRPDNKIDINIANEEQLRKLSGIGAARARQIMAKRPFKDMDDLQERMPGKVLWDQLPIVVEQQGYTTDAVAPKVLSAKPQNEEPITEAAEFKRAKSKRAQLAEKLQRTEKEVADAHTELSDGSVE